MGSCIGLRYLLRDNTFTCSIFSGPLWGLPVSEFTISILMPIFNLAISMGLGLLSYPYKIDGFNILTKPFEKNVLTKNLEFYNEMRDNLLIDPRLGLGPPTLYWIKALNDELDKLSKELNLNIHSKKDSVGICFVGEKNLRDFLNRFIKFKKGNILNTDNDVIGEHNGSVLYTIGQRQGLGIGGIKDTDELPWYVYGKNIAKNEIYVCQGVDNELLYTESILLDRIHWINEFKTCKDLECLVQIRHRHKPVKCKVEFNERINVKFEKEIRGVAPGQSAVFYKDNLCLGGGVIEARNNDL